MGTRIGSQPRVGGVGNMKFIVYRNGDVGIEVGYTSVRLDTEGIDQLLHQLRMFKSAAWERTNQDPHITRDILKKQGLI